MDTVLIEKCGYEYTELAPLIASMFERLAADGIRKGARILIKPNLLMRSSPDQGIVTHPLVVKAVAEYVLAKGARVQISDSPAVGAFDKVLKACGYRAAMQGLDVAFKPLETTLPVDVGQPFGRIPLAADIVKADVVINLAKLKTHAQMLLTLGVKNLFGCVVGLAKPQWHLRCGVHRLQFAQLMVRIYRAVAPAVTLIDGILGLEGQGPGRSGLPRRMNLLVGSRNALAADAAVCRVLGVVPVTLPTLKAAERLGLCSAEPVIHGAFATVEDFKLPDLAPVAFGPSPLKKLMRQHVLQKPVVDDRRCRVCGECGSYCPAKAIRTLGKRIVFAYDQCIRCYCCVEVCPHGALEAREPLAGKVLRKFNILK